ncbi:MAG: VWA domain-containing protein [Clostridium sp.]
MSNSEQVNRWRLILGKGSEENLDILEEYVGVNETLEFLYDRGKGSSNLSGRNLTVPLWINKVKKLFPKEGAKTLQHHALKEYNLKELLTNKDVLMSLEPNVDLLKSIMSVKSLMHNEVLITARGIVREIVKSLKEKMEKEIQKTIGGTLNKYTNGFIKSPQNLNIKKTIIKNLKNYDRENEIIGIDKVYFYGRSRNYNPYNIIIAVDESGSMLDSVIHSSIMASIFYYLPQFKTKLIIFDTQVVDLTEYVEDPVETLMSVQLGGGTNIAKALSYCEEIIDNPLKSIVVLVTDLYEGYDIKHLYKKCRDIIEGGSKLIVITSLDYECNGNYNKDAAKKISKLGGYVLETTPEGLVDLICKIV